jgi:hypothetical protein
VISVRQRKFRWQVGACQQGQHVFLQAMVLPHLSMPHVLTNTGSVRQQPNPAASWLQEPSWQQFLHLSAVPAYAGIADAIAADPASWRQMYDAADSQKATLPGHYSRLSEFRKLLVLRCVHLVTDKPCVPLMCANSTGDTAPSSQLQALRLWAEAHCCHLTVTDSTTCL